MKKSTVLFWLILLQSLYVNVAAITISGVEKQFAGKVKISNSGEFPISQINRIRGENELVLFNNYLGAGKTTRTDNNGTEVFIKPVDNQKWKTNEDVSCVVTRIMANQGANLLENGESVLSGNGTAQTFLSALSRGDILSVNKSVKTLTDNQYPQVEEMITGNALVMKDGNLTNRNYNEAYNSQLSATLSMSDIPASWTSGIAIKFTYKSGRAPFIKLTNQKPLYALPDSIKIIINTGDMQFDRALVSLRANNSKLTVSKEFNSFVTDGGNSEIICALSDFFDTKNIAVYPVWFDNFNFYLKTMTENQNYLLSLKEIQLLYGDNNFLRTQNPSAEKGWRVFPNPVQELINVRLKEHTGNVYYELVNLPGQRVMSQQSVRVDANIISIPVKGLAPGYYFLTIRQNNEKSTLKIIKN